MSPNLKFPFQWGVGVGQGWGGSEGLGGNVIVGYSQTLS